MSLEFVRRATNGIFLHCAEIGPAEGPLLILLHGFPEFWYGWRPLLEPLARAGFRVVAPDQRGYGESDKPKGVQAYDLDVLAADIVGLADTLGRTRFSVVGHDWGGIVAWWIARNHASRLAQMAVLNAGHPAVWKHMIRHNDVQRRASRYVATLVVPLLAEWTIRLQNYRPLENAICGGNAPLPDSSLAKYREAWQRPGALTGMLSWYRAIVRRDLDLAREPRITVPLRIIWGVKDVYGVPELATESAKLCDSAKILYIENATHWVVHDEPERVLRALLEFLDVAENAVPEADV